MSAPATAAAPADITAARLHLFAPRCDYLALAPHLDAAAKAHGIATPREVRHWLAQVYVESAGLTVLEENLNYSADELRATWPGRFDASAAARCARNPRAIACVAYGDRDGNRGGLDGWTYRGRGLLQITGRAAYRAAGQRLLQPYEDRPDLVAEAQGAAATGADFWRAHNLSHVLAGQPDEMAAVAAIRRVINGGENGLAAAQQQLRRAAMIWRA